jgi:hypothetical protein
MTRREDDKDAHIAELEAQRDALLESLQMMMADFAAFLLALLGTTPDDPDLPKSAQEAWASSKNAIARVRGEQMP